MHACVVYVLTAVIRWGNVALTIFLALNGVNVSVMLFSMA